MDLVAERYEPAVAGMRRNFDTHRGIERMMSEKCPDNLFELFFIRFSAHGVHMTEHVESWIRRAGARCEETGRPQVGRALSAHARSEAGHEQMMISDAHSLVTRWNSAHDMQLDAHGLISGSPLYSTRKYAELHESVIRSDRPYCQIAIEYEIERLSVALGPRILENCVDKLHDSEYTFLAEHVELDQGHTAFNRRQLQMLLEENEDNLVPLVETGRAALTHYLGFVSECIELAEADWDRDSVAPIMPFVG